VVAPRDVNDRAAALGPWSYLLVLLAPLAFAAVAIGCGIEPAVASLAATVGFALALVGLERWRPARRTWRGLGPDVPVDATHLGLGSTLVAGLQYAGIRIGVGVLAGHPGPWPSALPLMLQIVLALLVIELGQYVAHRSLHRVAWLWPFHAVHHSPRRLYWLNAFRAHPVDIVMTVVLPVMPLMLLGAGNDVLLGASLMTGVHALLQHTNVRFHEGALTYIFSSTTLHRWHHDRDLAHSEANYGSTLIVWDLVFRTRRAPPGEGPDVVGLAGGERLAERYRAQLAYPFQALRRRSTTTHLGAPP
jgi:sterol desaturase/sphingolipid hydroxylase (fatty acid hydroxylase superfamily)